MPIRTHLLRIDKNDEKSVPFNSASTHTNVIYMDTLDYTP